MLFKNRTNAKPAIAVTPKKAVGCDVLRNNSVVARTLQTATLSVDHRSVDAPSARFLAAINAAIEEPLSMIL